MASKSRRSAGGRAAPGPHSVVESPPRTEVCGYRLVRLLEQTDDVTTWLGTVAQPGKAVGSTPTAVAVLTCEREVAPSRIPEAVFTLSSAYVQTVLDVGSDDRGRLVLITERTQETLADLLAARSELRLGEAVTILVPITAGLRAMHDAGLAHGALSTTAVRFTPEGRPLIILIGVHSEAPVPAPADQGLRKSDLLALRTIMDQVFGRCGDRITEGVSSLLRWVDRSLGNDADDTFFPQLDLRLFALAEPLPIDFTPDRPGDDHAVVLPHAAPGRIRGGPAEEGEQQNTRSGVVARLFDGTGLNALAELAESYSLPRQIASRLAGLSGWALRAIQGRAAVVVVATTVAIVAMWGGLTAIPQVETAGADSSETVATEQPAATAVTPTEAELDAIEADDPLAALTALLALRSRCFETEKPACISLFDEADSAAEETDEHAIRSKGTALLPTPPGPDQVDVLQRTGNAALFRVSPSDQENQPVLVLVMKTTTGWRVRDLAVPG